MNILFITLGIIQDKGGIGRFNQLVLHSFSEYVNTDDSVRVNILSLWDEPEDLKEKYSGMQFYACGRKKLLFLLQFLRLIIATPITHMIFGHAILFGLIAFSKIKNCYTSLIVYGIDAWEKPSYLQRIIISELVNRIISISDYTVLKMAKSYGIDLDRFVLLPCAMEISEGSAHPQFSLDNEKYIILTVSRLSRKAMHKNVDKVIKALPIILRKYPNLLYRVVGTGDWEEELIKLGKSLNLENHIEFLGELTDQDRDFYYSKADIFVLPSEGEGFGIVFLEAWKFHLPVITSKFGAAPEVVRDGIDGFCIDPTPEDIAKTVLHLLSNEELRKRMGESGNKRLKEKYSYQSFKKRLWGLLMDTP